MKLEKKEIIVLCVFLTMSALIYLYITLTKKVIYTWDNACYYTKQLDLLTTFSTNFVEGIKSFITTTYREDYGNFLLSFTSFIFNLTNKTGEAFILTYFLTIVVPFLIVFALLIKKILVCYVKRENLLTFSLALLLAVTFPLLHIAALQGQPDIAGLIFLGLILLLTMDYDFAKIDVKRWIFLLGSVFCLVITRRWYLFWVISYMVMYGIFLIFQWVRKKDKEQIQNTLKFVGIAILVLGILLLPILKKTILANYGTSYSSWNLGGTKGEIQFQIAGLGYGYLIMMGIGAIYGFFRKETRAFTVIILGTGILALLLFTSIQNMGYHQSLILLPTYLLLFLLGILAIRKDNKSRTEKNWRNSYFTIINNYLLWKYKWKF